MATADAADMAFKHGRRIVEHGDAHTPSSTALSPLSRVSRSVVIVTRS
jgi:hypothetical protein